MDPIKVGIIGCGNISSIYLTNLTHMFKNIKLTACADIDISRAEAKASEKNEAEGLLYPGIRALTVDALLADPEIKIVVNLTIPVAHYDVAKKILLAGKCAYNEKPLALSREQGKELLTLAKEKGLLIGGAPDTFLGAGIQTCRKLIEDGWIGRPVSATAFMCCHGHESWHPAPEFYYLPGGGPMFDMGPYYLTALVNLLGPVKSVAGMTSRAFDTRTCTSAKRKNDTMPVEVETHVAGLLNFETGAVGTIITTFDIWKANLPLIEIHGTNGSLSVPDPNCFGGAIKLSRFGQDWKEIPFSHSYPENSRGLGVADMAAALCGKGGARASGELTYHVLDIMHAFHDSSREKKFMALESTCTIPAPLPADNFSY